MLAELRIEQFAIIEHLELRFEPGLIVFTGETGAGKSIIIDALEILLGGRPDASMIRSGAERAYIEATFQIPLQDHPEIHAILEREDLSEDSDYLVLSREIRSNGRNVARINGRIVNVGLARELGEFLVDVHGQSEHLSVLRVREHLNLLDRYAGVMDLRGEYERIYRALELIRHELKELRQAESDAARLADILTYQINEIEAARLEDREEEGLLAERTRLANAEELASLTQQTLLILDEGNPETPSAIDLLGQVLDALNHLARIDSSKSDLVEQCQDIFTRVTELASDIRSYSEEIEFNPKRLDQIEERLALIRNLQRKYGSTVEEIHGFAERARKQLDDITHSAERIAELETKEREYLAKLGELGTLLSQKRHAAAESLTEEMEAELEDLNMQGARFKIGFRQRSDPEGIPSKDGQLLAFDATGIDLVEFLIAPNPGEGLQPLVKTASGGETSRLMLALKNVLVRADQIPTLIFDEIDQGIGGRVGAVVGNKLWRLARHHQTLCITHLPQLAAFGEQHYQVRKDFLHDRTITVVEELAGEKRITELALMLGDLSESTLQSARDMIQATKELTHPAHVTG